MNLLNTEAQRDIQTAFNDGLYAYRCPSCGGTEVNGYLDALTASHIQEDWQQRFEDWSRPRPRLDIVVERVNCAHCRAAIPPTLLPRVIHTPNSELPAGTIWFFSPPKMPFFRRTDPVPEVDRAHVFACPLCGGRKVWAHTKIAFRTDADGHRTQPPELVTWIEEAICGDCDWRFLDAQIPFLLTLNGGSEWPIHVRVGAQFDMPIADDLPWAARFKRAGKLLDSLQNEKRFVEARRYAMGLQHILESETRAVRAGRGPEDLSERLRQAEFLEEQARIIASRLSEIVRGIAQP